MDDAEVLSLIRQALDEVAPDRADQFEKVTLATEIKDLDIDSIVTLEMVGSIEDRLASTFDEDELAKVKNLGDIAALIRTGKVG